MPRRKKAKTKKLKKINRNELLVFCASLFAIGLFLISFGIIRIMSYNMFELRATPVETKQAAKAPDYKFLYDNGFMVEYPTTARWSSISGLPSSIRLGLADSNGCQIFVSREALDSKDKGLTFKQIIDQSLAAEKKRVDEFNVLIDERGTNTAFFEIAAKLGGRMYHYLSKGILIGDSLYSAVAMAAEDSFSVCRSAGERLVNSVKYIE